MLFVNKSIVFFAIIKNFHKKQKNIYKTLDPVVFLLYNINRKKKLGFEICKPT